MIKLTFPTHGSKLKANLQTLWQDIMRIKDKLTSLSFARISTFPTMPNMNRNKVSQFQQMGKLLFCLFE